MSDIKLPERLFEDLVRYFWANQREPEREARIKAALEEKVRAAAKRQNYTGELFSGKQNAGVTPASSPKRGSGGDDGYGRH